MSAFEAMSAFKEAANFVCKIVGGFAVVVFLLAPLTGAGLLAMAGSLTVALICGLGGYLLSGCGPRKRPGDGGPA